MKIQKIEVKFPFEVEMPDNFDRALSYLINIACKKYESEHPDRVMWPSGFGSKPIWREPDEPLFDDTIYHIEVAERQSYEGMTRDQKYEAMKKSIAESLKKKSDDFIKKGIEPNL